MAQELGLIGNNPENTKKMMDKQYMHNALKESGLRHIRSREISSFEEAKEFISEIGGSKFVIKPSIGQSTQGVCVCTNDEEINDAIQLNENLDLGYGDGNILIQEFIEGEEYCIDSTCCEGHNRIVCACHYIKKVIEGRGPIFDYVLTIDENNPHFKELAEYNEKVLSAIGLEYGATHAEYKIDENGPVLIEINCRVSGPAQKYTFMDKVWGEHATESALESYLNPEECIKKSKKQFHPISFGAAKMLIVPREISVGKSYVQEAFKDLDSHEYAISMGDDRIYPKTIDLHTAGGLIFLSNKNQEKLIEDINTIKRMEDEEIEKIFDIES